MFNTLTFREQLIHSLETRQQQGCVVDGLRARLEQTDPDDFAGLSAIYAAQTGLPGREGYDYQEPDELTAIRSLRPDGPRQITSALTDLELRDKVQAGLTGRICGVILGRPVEGWSPEDIAQYLQGANAYPLDYYIPSRSRVGNQDKTIYYERLASTREYLRDAEADDDINYLILALKLIEKTGNRFTTLDVGYNWLDNMAVNWIWGAERTAYLNLARYTDGRPRHRYPELDDALLWQISHHLNDFDESIGALIRGDLFGLVSVGQPELAAELAYRDAAFTHVKNGIYGEMFIAAMIAAAFFTSDIREIIQTGLSEIPANCRLAEAVRDVMRWHGDSGDWQAVRTLIAEHYGQYDKGHVINNSAIIANGLLAGSGDLEKTLCITVMQGLDTDCTAATAGMIAGILSGTAGIPAKWTDPLHQTVRSTVAGESVNSIERLARRVFNVAAVLLRQSGRRKYRFNEPR